MPLKTRIKPADAHGAVEKWLVQVRLQGFIAFRSDASSDLKLNALCASCAAIPLYHQHRIEISECICRAWFLMLFGHPSANACKARHHHSCTSCNVGARLI